MSADAQADTLDADFPTRRILAIVGDKWTTVVLYCLSTREHRRFNELQRQIPDISKKMLIQNSTQPRTRWAFGAHRPSASAAENRVPAH